MIRNAISEFGGIPVQMAKNYDLSSYIAKGQGNVDSDVNIENALPLMKWGGSIVLISSYLHSKGLSEHNTYAATKAAIRSFARTWAAELKDRKIRVNTLSPGAIETQMIDGQLKTKEEANQARALFCSVTPLGRIGRPEEMAAAALFLASDDSSYVTAADLAADGGAGQV
jgi:NAD(P)-dependent dehydrogenase (short-subunit alcohol dehydrogenase family)